MALLAGLDLGTSSIKAVLYDSDTGQVTGQASQPTPVDHPRTGWSQHDPQQLWEAACACLRAAAKGKEVRGLAISSMAEAGIPIAKDGRELYAVIAWYDRRSLPQAEWIETHIDVARLFRITGQRVSSSFGATKWMWLRDNQPEATAQMSCWLPLPSYLFFRFTGKMAVDYSIASRTLLFDQQKLDWSTEMLALCGLPEGCLPAAFPGGTLAGELSRTAAVETGLPTGTPCVLGGHDHLCAAFAAGAFQPGSAVDSSGTAQALALILPSFLQDPALGEHGYACYTHVIKGQYQLKAGLKSAGSSIEWLARLLSAPEAQPDYSALETLARKNVGARAGPIWLPHLVESGSPESDRLSRAALAGLRLEHEPGDLFRGMLEALAFWTRRNLEDMTARTGYPAGQVTLLGGVTRLLLLCELKAAILGRTLRVSQVPEAAAVGAALLAGLGAGIFQHPAQAVASLRYQDLEIEPQPRLSAWYDRLYREAYLPLYENLRDLNWALARMESEE